MSPWRSLVFIGIAAAVICGLACGGNPAGPTPIASSTFTGTVTNGRWTSHTFPIEKTGTLTVTLSWSTATNDLDLVLTDGWCSPPQGLDPWGCPSAIEPGRKTPTSETATQRVTNLTWSDCHGFPEGSSIWCSTHFGLTYKAWVYGSKVGCGTGEGPGCTGSQNYTLTYTLVE